MKLSLCSFCRLSLPNVSLLNLQVGDTKQRRQTERKRERETERERESDRERVTESEEKKKKEKDDYYLFVESTCQFVMSMLFLDIMSKVTKARKVYTPGSQPPRLVM
jgi:glutathionyl-hydroquinone reductase